MDNSAGALRTHTEAAVTQVITMGKGGLEHIPP
ncbi:hypothetical protein MSS2_00730 [Mycobacterium marinum]|nr:hypothetical protein MSS2_00730 [Mycobacterium marinum]